MQAEMYPDTLGQEIAQSICKLLPASCKTLKKLTFEAMDRSGQDPLHIAAKDIKSRIEMKYESESLPMSDCDSEDRDRWLSFNQYISSTWSGPFPVFTDASLDLYQNSESKGRLDRAVSRYRLLSYLGHKKHAN